MRTLASLVAATAAFLAPSASAHISQYCGHQTYTTTYDKVKFVRHMDLSGHWHRYAHYVKTPTSPTWSFTHSAAKTC